MASEAMWLRIQPALATVGVTRLADVTGLDQVGIPCWQAIRPAARTLSVAQGKGLTPRLAALSAAMEAIEVWHAENLPDGDLDARVGDVESALGYPLRALRTRPRAFLHRGTRLEWTRATRLTDGGESLVPTAALRLDSEVRPVWDTSPFDVSSNGLASGESRTAAVLHGLCEVVERDAMTSAEHLRRTLPAAEVPDVASELIERFCRAGLHVLIESLPTDVGLPVFRVLVYGDDFPAVFCGSAAALDATAALCNALAEAAQSRVAAIAGTREDLGTDLYDGPAATGWAGRSPHPPDVTTTWSEVTTRPIFRADPVALAECIEQVTGFSPLLVDHTRTDVDIPVVRVISLGLNCPPDY